MEIKEKKLRKRFTFFLIITILFTLIVLWRYFALMVLTPTNHNLRPTFAEGTMERGPILDRNGRILAIQNEMDSVEAWIPYVDDVNSVCTHLAHTLDLDENLLISRMMSRRGSMWIKRKITPTESDEIHALIKDKKLPGIFLRTEYGRSYPQQNLASHLLGYAGTDNNGLEGIEYTLDQVLAPQEHLNSGGDRYGNQVFLTLDVNIQFFAEKLARTAFEEHKADSVTMLVMDAKNADILAYASVPDFDPNTFQLASALERKNRPIVSAYEPGSVFKVFSLAAMLDSQSVGPSDVFYCDGSYENDTFPGEIGCLGHHGWVTPYDIVKFSCNAGAAYASDQIEEEELYSYLRGFGFGAATQLPLPGESNGLLRDPAKWSARSKPTLAMGQEILVSAVQITTAATAFANNGVLLKPHVIDKIVSPNGNIIEDYPREPVRQVLSPETAQEVLLMMETATETGGTAWRLKTPGIRVSSKTGTAQMTDPETGEYSQEKFGASCLAIFPTDDPKYILYIIIETPRGDSYYGGTIASPVIKSLIDELIRYTDMPRSGEQVINHPGSITLPGSPDISWEETIPDLTGLSKRELLPFFAMDGIHFHIDGEGWVKAQSPAPGTPITEGMTITLELR